MVKIFLIILVAVVVIFFLLFLYAILKASAIASRNEETDLEEDNTDR